MSDLEESKRAAVIHGSRPVHKKAESNTVASQELLYATQSMIRTYLIDICRNMIYGKSSRYLKRHNIVPELASKLYLLSAQEMEDLAASYARKLFSSPGDIPLNLTINLNETLSLIQAKHEDSLQQLAFLKAGASNHLMEQHFGTRAMESRLLRTKYGIAVTPGRKTRPKGEDVRRLILTTHEGVMKETRCPRSALINTHLRTGHCVDFINQVVTEYQNLAY